MSLLIVCCFISLNYGQDMNKLTLGIQNAVEKEEIRAAVLATYDNGETVIHGFGHVSSSTTDVPDGDTIFEIGSITKVFTAVLAQVLVDAETLNWDDPISKHLTEIEFASPDVAAITLKELATHTSGLPRLANNMQPEDALDPYADYDQTALHEFLGGFQPQVLTKQPAYSNLGMGLLGHILGKAVDMSYPDALRHFVLEPLALSSTSATYEGLITANIATGSSNGADMPRWTFDVIAGAGAILSNAEDLLRFIAHACTVNPKNEVQSLQKTLMVDEGQHPLAWQVLTTSNNEQIFWHNGGTGGYATVMAVDPVNNKGWVLLTSSTEYTSVTDIGLNMASRDESEEVKVNLAPYVGVFELIPEFYFTISESDGKLFAQATGQGKFPLTFSGKALEFKYDAAQIQIRFDDLIDGQSPGFEIIQAGQSNKTKRVSDDLGIQEREEIEVSEEALLSYVGKYELAPQLIIDVTARDKQLYIQLTGQPALPVFATSKDRFFYKVVDAEIQFQPDGETVSSLTLYQNGEHVAPRIE